MRGEAIEGERPRAVASLPEALDAARDVPDTWIELVALNSLPSPGADDPMEVATVLSIVERQQIEVGTHWLGSIEVGVRDDAVSGNQWRADDCNPDLPRGLLGG